MLDALALADGAAEHLAFARITRGAVQRIAAKTDGLRSDQDARGIKTVEQIAEAFAFFADAVFIGHEQIVDEHRVRIHRGTTHLRDAAYLDLRAIERGVE